MKLLIKLFFALMFLSQYDLSAKPSILVLFYAPPAKVARWNDGFVSAMRLVENDYDVLYYNLENNKFIKHIPGKEFFTIPKLDYSKFDAILVKSNWGKPHQFALKNLPKKVPKALLISGVSTKFKRSEMFFYDLLFYETEWYRPNIEEHPNIIHAFGINTEIMKPPKAPVEKKYDYISVGVFHECKRFEKILKKPGRRLVVGSDGPQNQIHQRLVRGGVKVMRTVKPEELVQLYHESKCCYLPCRINGGGERALLEARSCGIDVEVEDDNPKLKELVNSPIYDHVYYYEKLVLGIEKLLKKDA